MKRRTHDRLVTDLASFTERYLIGGKLSIHQRDLIKAITSGKTVLIARYGRGNSRLHLVNGRFVATKPQWPHQSPARPSRLKMFVDEMYDD